MRLSDDQKKILSEAVANVGVAWFAGGVVAPVLGKVPLSEILKSGLWGLAMFSLSVIISLALVRAK